MTTPAPTNHLTDEQVERLVLAINYCKDTNPIAAVAWAALQKESTLEGQRRVLVTVFAQTYELMLVMNMATNSTIKAEEFQSNLNAMRRHNSRARDN